MKREAKAIWNGNLQQGSGVLETKSQVLKDTPYSFHSRFHNQSGTNPEELIAAAHAGCFSMALSNELQLSQLTAKKIETRAYVSLENIEGQWKVTGIHLQLEAEIPGAHRAAFMAAAARAKANCPISKLLNTQITLESKLIGDSELSVPPEVVIYTSTHCQVCGRTKGLLENRHISFREVDLDEASEEVISHLKKQTGRMSVPQIFVAGQYIGDYDDLIKLDLEHKLEHLLSDAHKHVA